MDTMLMEIGKVQDGEDGGNRLLVLTSFLNILRGVFGAFCSNLKNSPVHSDSS
jgi:hypothetical protein